MKSADQKGVVFTPNVRRSETNGESKRWWGRGKPPRFDRLRWWMSWYGGSRGKVRRMRAGPVVPVEVAWRWEGTAGGSSQELLKAGSTSFHHERRTAREELFWRL